MSTKQFKVSYSTKRCIWVVADRRDPAAVATFDSQREVETFLSQES